MEALRVVRVFNVQCVLCSRVSGQIVNGVYLHDAQVQPPRVGPRCGECGGSLYVEVDGEIPPEMAQRMLSERGQPSAPRTVAARKVAA